MAIPSAAPSAPSHCSGGLGDLQEIGKIGKCHLPLSATGIHRIDQSLPYTEAFPSVEGKSLDPVLSLHLTYCSYQKVTVMVFKIIK